MGTQRTQKSLLERICDAIDHPYADFLSELRARDESLWRELWQPNATGEGDREWIERTARWADRRADRHKDPVVRRLAAEFLQRYRGAGM